MNVRNVFVKVGEVVGTAIAFLIIFIVNHLPGGRANFDDH